MPAVVGTHTPAEAPVRIDAALIRRLIAGQFPQGAHLPLEPVLLGGWNDRTFPFWLSNTNRFVSKLRFFESPPDELTLPQPTAVTAASLSTFSLTLTAASPK